MAIETATTMGTILGWFSTLIFWIIVIVVIVGVLVISLFLRRKRALTFQAFECTFLKDGKMVIEHQQAGWFGKEKGMLGLYSTGRKVMKLADGRLVRDFSVDDYHEYRKRKKQMRCLFVTSHPEDKTMVVPISAAKLDPETLKAVYEIAPADYREAAVDAFNESAKELRGGLDRLLPYILLGGIVIFFIVGIVINGQLISKAVDSATGLLADAGDTLENVANLISTQPSTTAP